MMKKKWLTLLAAVLLVCALTLGMTVSAADSFVLDDAGLLSGGEINELNAAAQRIADQYGCGVYVVTVDNFKDYGFSRIEDFTEAFYNQNNLGYGSDRSALLLALSMAERDYDLAAHGDTANKAFTDYGKVQLLNGIADNLHNNDWAGGFSEYMSTAGEYLDLAARGTPVDVPGQPQPQKKNPLRGLFSVIPGALIAWLTCGSMKSSMKTARLATEAKQYITTDGVHMSLATANYTHTTTVRQPIAQGGSGTSGGTTVNSGGFSHSSGKF